MKNRRVYQQNGNGQKAALHREQKVPPTRAKAPYFTGEMCYSLRCSFLHDGNWDIQSWGEKEDVDFYYSYKFELAVGGADAFGSSWIDQVSDNDSKLMKTNIVRVNIDKLCESICLAAENYYRLKDPTLFNRHEISYIDFNQYKGF
ncbi:hypothetical protein CHH58_13415 [Terribacillus saccharophilus]|uniref:hypothetical protein n=1 Tax=Terribacillus saccharophilus TaxID=361277 RepID=UPI000BA53ECC|nr:hypothetical protein [Terribacillus saccharophilus]PAF36244.1 hypothetical protein CHH58_13415 [Terribacillus saccharophilus]